MKYFEQNEYLILSMKYLILFVKYFMLLVKQLMLSVKYLNKGRNKIPNNFQTFRTVQDTLTVKYEFSRQKLSSVSYVAHIVF